MKLLITGATGYLGSNLVKRLEGNDLHIIVRKSSDISMIPKKVSIYKDEKENDTLLKYFVQNQFDGVIHLAALTLVDHHFKDISGLVESNIEFPCRILEAAAQTNVKWFINTGTFWQNYQNASYSPVNLYAATKQAFESLSKYYIETNSIKFCSIRLNDTYGPNDPRSKIFNLWNKISKSAETIDMTPGDQIIDLTYIDDIIDAYLLLINNLNSQTKEIKNGEVFVVMAEQRYTLKELAEIFQKTNNCKLNINWGGKAYRKREVMVPFKNGKLVPGWQAKVSIQEGMKKIINNN